jgi:hypothetical protein
VGSFEGPGVRIGVGDRDGSGEGGEVTSVGIVVGGAVGVGVGSRVGDGVGSNMGVVVRSGVGMCVGGAVTPGGIGVGA